MTDAQTNKLPLASADPARIAQHITPALEEAFKAVPGFEEGSLKVARSIHNAVLNGGEPTRKLADALHGVWLGHPLHPVLVHLPIGAFALSAVFDVIAAAGGSEQAEQTADSLIVAGIATAVPAAMAGAMDYSAIHERAAPIAATHALLNNVSLGLYLLALGARRSERRGLGVALSTVALGVLGVSGYLGTSMVYHERVGVNHAPTPTQPDSWLDVLADHELPMGEARRIELGNEAVLLYRDDDAIHAIGATCSHAGGPLEQGTINNHCVECPWHQSVFDLRDGSVVHGPAVSPVGRYEARLNNGRIELRRWKPEELPAGLPADSRVVSDVAGQEREYDGSGI